MHSCWWGPTKREGSGEIPTLTASPQVSVLMRVVAEDLEVDIAGKTRRAGLFSQNQPQTVEVIY